MIKIISMMDFRTIFARGTVRHLHQNERLFQVDAPVRQVFLVTKGRIRLERPLADGSVALFQIAAAQEILAEASVYADHYHCEARACEASSTLSVDLKSFCDHVHTGQCAAAWGAYLARAVHSTRLRAEIRSLKTVRARLDAWLAAHGALPGKGQIQHVASEIAVTREALYRELSRRRG